MDGCYIVLFMCYLILICALCACYRLVFCCIYLYGAFCNCILASESMIRYRGGFYSHLKVSGIVIVEMASKWNCGAMDFRGSVFNIRKHYRPIYISGCKEEIIYSFYEFLLVHISVLIWLLMHNKEGI